MCVFAQTLRNSLFQCKMGHSIKQIPVFPSLAFESTLSVDVSRSAEICEYFLNFGERLIQTLSHTSFETCSFILNCLGSWSVCDVRELTVCYIDA